VNFSFHVPLSQTPVQPADVELFAATPATPRGFTAPTVPDLRLGAQIQNYQAETTRSGVVVHSRSAIESSQTALRTATFHGYHVG
jgi:hypothetical protein